MFNDKLGFWSKKLNELEIFGKPATYVHVMGQSAGPSDSAESTTINLIRAVYDESDKVVQRITRELAQLEIRREQLILERDAHTELFAVATKYVTKAGVK